MKKVFLKWLLIFVIATIVVVGISGIYLVYSTGTIKEEYESVKKDLALLTNRYEGFLANVPASIIFYKVLGEGATSMDYQIISVNPFCLRLEGWQYLDVVGKTLHDLFPGKLSTKFTQALQKMFIGGKSRIMHTGAGKSNDRRYFRVGIYKVAKDKIATIYLDITKEYEHVQHMERLSYRDSLTGLYNRHFYRKYSKRFNSKEGLPMTMIMGDLVGLKLINDAFGHEKGDEAIVKVSEKLQEILGLKYIFRWGGDEFLILVPKTSREEGRVIRDRIINEFQNLYLDGIKLEVSFGRSCKNSEDELFKDVLKRAEDKLYLHKLLTAQHNKGNILNSIKLALFEKSSETEEHGERMWQLCKKIATKLSFTNDALAELEIFAMLHDIGKISIDNSILEKKGKLTEDEWAIIKTHPITGYRIASSLPELENIAQYILTHHERWDGKGYPRGLKGEEIPLPSRILAIADTYDAMTNDRSYRKALSHEEAIEEIRNNSGTQFDPKVVDKFLEVIAEKSN